MQQYCNILEKIFLGQNTLMSSVLKFKTNVELIPV